MSVELETNADLPSLKITVEPAQMFFFSAATYNGHRIHYDRRWAVEVEGYPDVIVQGQLQAALLARLVTDWMGPHGSLQEFTLQNRGAAFAGETLEFGGRIESVQQLPDSGQKVHLVLEGRKTDGTVVMPGSAVVHIAEV